MLHEVEVWVLVDENGDYVAATDEDSLGEIYDNVVGGDAALCRRSIKLTVKIDVSQTVELCGKAPAEGTASLKVG